MDSITVGPLESIEDIDNLLPIIRRWVRDPQTGLVIPEEVGEIKGRLEDCLAGKPDYLYLIGRTTHNIAVAMLGLRDPEELMRSYVKGRNTREIVNFFVHPDLRGAGIGSLLLKAAISTSQTFGVDELILNSGPRYASTAWPFYNKRFGPSIAVAKDFYGEGRDAPVWAMKI